MVYLGLDKGFEFGYFPLELYMSAHFAVSRYDYSAPPSFVFPHATNFRLVLDRRSADLYSPP